MRESLIIDLLQKANISVDCVTLSSCNNGNNNRNYRVDTHTRSFWLKHYFSHPLDTRNRLKTEWEFMTYACEVAPTFIAKPLLCDCDKNIGLFDFIEGKKFHPNKITQKDVDQAFAFFAQLNQSAGKINAMLSNASEACFSISAHIDLVDFRIHQLQQVHVDAENLLFKHILTDLKKIWDDIKKHLNNHTYFAKHNVLLQKQYCISPSDFGFHNALKKSDGEIIFFDFEYAGWDDPAKMVCDFFSQIEVPISSEFFESFLKKVMALFPHSDLLIDRALLLKPLFLVKWCCIVLNVFLPHHLARKQFSRIADVALLQKAQLEKAQKIMEHIYARN